MIFWGYTGKFVFEGHRVKVKVTVAKKRVNSPFPQCKTSISNNSGSTEDNELQSMRTALGLDRHLCHVTGNTRIHGWSALDEKAILFLLWKKFTNDFKCLCERERSSQPTYTNS